MTERLQFIAAYLNHVYAMTELCEHFGIRRNTGYKALIERRAMFWPSKAALGLKSAGNQPVVMAGTRKTAFRASGTCAETAYHEVWSALEGQT